MNSTDGEYQIGYGTLDNLRMNQAGKFTEMTIFQSASQNGVYANYTLEFKAAIPIFDGDIFYLVLPPSIDAPKEPNCNPIKCLDSSTSCTSEKGRIVVQFKLPQDESQKDECGKEDAIFSFDVEGIQNSNSMLHSEPIEAYFTSSSYQLVAEFQAAKPTLCGIECVENTEDGAENYLSIANLEPGYIDAKNVFVDQQSKDFGIENLYTIRFKSSNPIPNIGWVKITYPTTVVIADETAFVESCEAVTSASYKGENHCKLIKDTREVWIYDAFMDQTAYTSEIVISFLLTNPVTNKKEKPTKDMTEEERTEYLYG